MAETVDIVEFLSRTRSSVTIDVRSPGEFTGGHIPNACNVPLFDDAGRAAVGTLYKNSGREAAVLLGLDLVGPRMREIVEQVQKISRTINPANKSVCLHCWRGGMRSQSVAWLLEQAGFQVTLLDGGYKSWRRHVRTVFAHPWEIVVLSGLTGAGKTALLHKLYELGEQVIDLERLANHRGSAFGAIGLPDQPSVEQFENNLAVELSAVDPSQKIWVEDEGNRIGRVTVPVEFYDQYRNAPAIFMDVPRSKRVVLLAGVYGDLSPEEIEGSIENIRKRLGGQNVNEAIRLFRAGDILACTDLLLEYYDRAYRMSLGKMPRTMTHEVEVPDPAEIGTAERLIQLADQILLGARL